MFRRFVGIDLGTSGLRLVVLDATGACVLQLRRPWPDGLERNPVTWLDAVHSVLRAASEQLPLEPVALAVDGTSGSLLLLDAAGTPVAPPLMYDDARALREAARLQNIAPRDSAAHGATSSAAKLLWLRAQGALAGASRVLHQAEWIGSQLRGDFSRGDENNALKLGYDPVTGSWPTWWREELGADARLLPEVVATGTPLGRIAPNWAVDTGLHPESQIVAGTTDSIAGFLATGVNDTRTGVTSLGSTLVLKQLCDQPLFDPDAGVYSHRVLGRWLVGGASNSGGAVLAKHFTPESLDRLSTRIDPGEDSGLDYYPLTAPGERFPVSDPRCAPRLDPRPGDDARFLQGMLEGIARIEAAGYRRLAELGAAPVNRIVTVGGGARNPAWTAIRSRLIGVPVETAPHEEAAWGAALLAMQGVGATPD
ncbi:MAG TPA: FGGY-family carbohydrate kinase [Thioalkalivibrio sp.]|nr:FGGY-family carbohydrate kinase [Thioalkalivibrio sp.]